MNGNYYESPKKYHFQNYDVKEMSEIPPEYDKI